MTPSWRGALILLILGALGDATIGADIALWSMDEGSGAVAASSINSPSADALFLGDPKWTSTLLPPVASNTSAIQLDGSSFLQSESQQGIAADSARSISAWIRTTGNGNQVIVDSGEQGTGTRFTFRLNGNATQGVEGALRLEVGNGYVVANTPVNDGQWHHAAVTFPMGGSVDDAALYVDGVLDGDLLGTPFSDVLDVAVNTGPGLINIGRRVDGVNSWNGVVDQVQFWDEELSAGTVSSLVPGGALPTLAFQIDRATGGITLQNGYGAPINGIVGYSLTSGVGALDTASWTSVTDHYDVDSGTPTFDSDDEWVELTDTLTPDGMDLSEFVDSGDGGILSTVVPLDLGNAWRRLPVEDIQAELIFDSGDRQTIAVEYVGTPHELADLNFDGSIGAGDWDIFRQNLLSDLSNLSVAEAYQLGDLDFDGDNDRFDFVLFESAYDAAQGIGSLRALQAVPEPGSLVGLGIFLCLGIMFYYKKETMNYRRLGCCRAQLLFACLLGTWMCTTARADVIAYLDFESPNPLSDKSFNGSDGTVTVGTTTAIEGGLIGDALRTIGATDSTADSRVTIPQASAPAFGVGNLSVSLWFKRGPQVETGSTDGIYDSLSGTTSGLQLMLRNNGSLNGRFDTDGGGSIVLETPTGAIEADTDNAATFQWHHVLFSIDRTAITPTASLYVDGVLEGSLSGIDVASIVGDTITPSQDMFIGQGNTQVADGFLDDLAFYDVALTQQDALNLSNQTAAPSDFLERLKLRVDLNSGRTYLSSTSNSDTDFDYYDITSDTSSLDDSSWMSLESQGLSGFPSGTGVGDGWEEAGQASSMAVGEAFLDGFSSLSSSSTPVNLGLLWDTAGSQDLVFTYRDTATGTFKQGMIEYFVGVGVPGDFNADGTVNLADYTVWRDNLGAAISLPNEDATLGTVTSEDYQTWKTNFGASSGAGAIAAIAVPTPASVHLLVLGMVSACVVRVRRTQTIAAFCCLLSAGSAMASKTTDRLYEFGDSSIEQGQIGQLISNNLNTTGFTFDGVGDGSPGTVAGEFIDLRAEGGAAYIAGRLPGTVAASFNGTDSYLHGRRLGLPESSASSDDALLDGVTMNPGPFDYSGIVNRGFQFWVNPATLPSTTQTIIRDTTEHQVAIGSSGNWLLRYSGETIDSGVLASPGSWTHVMLVRPHSGEPTAGARLYIDGEVIAAIGGGYNGSDNSELVVGATLDSEGLATEHFSGIVDELDLFVLGTSSDNRTRYGVFSPGVDNDFIATAISNTAGDITLDGNFNSDDLDKFIAGWRSENRVNGLLAGDLASYQNGDLDFNGVVDIGDAMAMHQLSLNGGFGTLLGRLETTVVPEPAASHMAVLLSAAVCGTYLKCLHPSKNAVN